MDKELMEKIGKIKEFPKDRSSFLRMCESIINSKWQPEEEEEEEE